MNQQQADDCMTIFKKYFAQDSTFIQFSSQLGTTVLPHNEGLAVTIAKDSEIKENSVASQIFFKMSELAKKINVNQGDTYRITLRTTHTGYYFLIKRNEM